MSSDAAVLWLTEQLPAMEAALEALVLQNSYTTHVDGGRRVGRILLDLFAMPGLEAEVVESQRFAPHLVFRSQGHARKPIALVGHLDTVFPPGHFEGYVVDGIFRRGPGVLDMKGGLVVMAWALKAVAVTAGLDAVPPLRVVIASDEELGSPESAKLLLGELDGAAACLVFESGRSNDAIVTQRKGTGVVQVKAFGKAAHAGNAYFDGANAIWSLARFIDRAQALSNQDTGVTVNVGLVHGGSAKNTVPAEAGADLDLRYPTVAARDALLHALEDAAKEAAVPGTRLELHPSQGRLPMERGPGTQALFDAYAECAKREGLGTAEAPRQGGGSDGNTAASLGIPTLDALGPRGSGYHTTDECIEIATLVGRAAALARFLLRSS